MKILNEDTPERQKDRQAEKKKEVHKRINELKTPIEDTAERQKRGKPDSKYRRKERKFINSERNVQNA